jgi:hypothetical protein
MNRRNFLKSILLTTAALLIKPKEIVKMAELRSSIPEMWTDGIDRAGVTTKMSFRLLVRNDETGEMIWHYFGTEESNIPPTDGRDVVEHPEISFPKDLDELGSEADTTLYTLSVQVAKKKYEL